MNPWQNWLQTLAQQQNSTGNSPTAQWEKSWQQWQANAENAWSSPASYWQAVSSIMSARARSVSEAMQAQPANFAALAQCKSFPEVVACLTRWQGHTLVSAINLATITQAHRGNLVAQWQRQFPFMSANPATFMAMWNNTPWGTTKPNGGTVTSPTPAPTPKPATQPAPVQTTPAQQAAPTVQAQPASTYVQPLGTFIPAPRTAPQTEPVQSKPQPVQPMPQVQPKLETPAPVQLQPKAAPATAAATVTSTTSMATSKIPEAPTSSITKLVTTEPVNQPVAATGTHGVPVNTPVISSTANSVMRSSTGSTIAAAAARRSVVARRASGNRRRAPR